MYKPQNLVFACLAIAGLTSCSDDSIIPSFSHEYVFTVQNPDEIEPARAALTKRFERLNGALIYTVTSKTIDDSVHITTFGPEVNFDSVRRILFAPGFVRFVSDKYLPILTNRHIKSARYGKSDGQHGVFVELTDEGNRLLARWIESNLGKEIRIEIDKEVVFRSTVTRQLGKRFVIKNGYTEIDALVIALYLNSPELKTRVNVKKVNL